MKSMTDTEKKIARLLQDIPLVKSPFAAAGATCNLTGTEIMQTAFSFRKLGIMRRFGAVLNHHKAGFSNNALVVWSVPGQETEKTGKILSSFSFISHCYERRPAFLSKYNIFTMLHADTENIVTLTKTISEAINNNDYLILESIEEYKKTSPEYFHDGK